MSKVDPDQLFIERVGDDAAFDHVFAIRQEVFVQEYSIDHEADYDGFDHLSHHYLMRVSDEPAATARWRRVQTGGRYRIERLAVRKKFRRQGIGTALLHAVLQDIPKDKEIFLHCPIDSADFFLMMGFEKTGFVFEEAGIDHIKLVFR